MKKLLIAVIAAFTLMGAGCDDGDTVVHNNIPPAPVAPVPVPDDDISADAPTTGTGSIRAHIDANGGYVTITYSFPKNANIDSNSFVLIHSENGEERDTITPAVWDNGSVSKLEEDVYIAPNRTDDSIVHTFKLTYFTFDGIARAHSWVVTQPAEKVDDNKTAITVQSIF